MMTYICRNRDPKTGERLPCTGNVCETSRCPVCGGRAEGQSQIYWCENCKVPIFEAICGCCGAKAKRLSSDVRPVFPEERLLLEILQGRPFAYMDSSVWNGSGNHYYVNGKKIPFSVKELREKDPAEVRRQYEELKGKNTSDWFDAYIARFIHRNRQRYEYILEEANSYIRSMAEQFSPLDMFISFSGGKDSTVTSDLVIRALSHPQIMHIFGDTTLEFPFTYEYVERYKKAHSKTPFLVARNRDKDFWDLCKQIGPPSRVMRWCCTVFKTGSIQKKIRTLYRDKKEVLTFYGIRRGESVSRSKYEREADSPKITKQRIVAPIIDWTDFDVWLYLLTTGIDFNQAYRFGYARVGCWCCPNNSGWSEFLSKVYLPEEWDRFHQILVQFAESIGKKDAEAYVEEGGWKARQGGNGVAHAQRSVVSFQPCAAEENSFYYELQRPITTELYELFKPFGYLNDEVGNRRLGEMYVFHKNGEIILKLQGRIGTKNLRITIVNELLIGARDIKTARERVECQLVKYQMCIGCLACESVCRYDALSIKEQVDGTIQYRISDKKCIHCGGCVNHFTAGCYMRKVLTIKRNGGRSLVTDKGELSV